MHGKISLTPGDAGSGVETITGRIREFLRQRARWLLIVVLPTLLVGSYYWFIAAGQYESEAHILVRSTQASGASSAGLGQALSFIGGLSAAPSDAASVSDYLSSHDSVEMLREREQLVERFRRPEADILSRLTPANPTPERLLRFFRQHVDVKLEPESGITVIKVRSFRPQDSYQIVNALLRLGERRVNTLNARAYESSLRMATLQLSEAERLLRVSQQQITAFRQQRRNIDPMATGQAQIEVVSGLQARLAQTRAQRASMLGSIAPSSPQARAMDGRVRALETQVASESSRLTGGSQAIAAKMGDYQELQLRQQFAAKRYDSAAAALQAARDQAQKQQLFVVRVVEPNLPGKALYPKSATIIITLFVSLMLCYALGWLIVAGVKEHAA